ncbi:MULTISPECIES: alpha-ketoacid dehydrogenase subunit beta [unclassified Nitrospina]|uniref:alpha-ketoacid dehydrogenase subunit beta n=1 Tax=unclassified Nitrospina TaxID=2638683 RepID=UPI003F958F3E
MGVNNDQRILKYREALNEGLTQAMDADPSVFVMGCGVDDEGGIFGTTRAAFEKFGKERVMDVPLAENSIAGIGVGSALLGKRPVIVHARNDFLLLAMDQIINHAAKWEIMSGGKMQCPMLIRAIIGRGWGQAAQHSQSLQAFFSHVPGLKVMLPASAYDAKGLLMAALEDTGTVLSIEHRLLYETESHVPEESYTVPLGKAAVKREGTDVTIVAFSFMVKDALDAAGTLSQEGIAVEVLDPRCSSPLDMDCILDSVQKTGRLIVADTGWTSFGITAEIAARVQEQLFDSLKAPILRVALPDRNTPCSGPLEKDFYPGVEDICQAARRVTGATGEMKAGDRTAPLEHSTFQGPF